MSSADVNSKLIPLEKLISRLRTDLKLSETYDKSLPKGYPKPGIVVQRKNQRKMSILHYLEELQEMKKVSIPFNF